MNKPLDELYLQWLYDHVRTNNSRMPTRNHWKLMRQLYTTEFIWFVPNDDNRVGDGQDLRHEFTEDLDLEDVDPDWMTLGCSMLELILGLSRRLSFQAEGEPRFWFWQLLKNLGLHEYNDRDRYDRDHVEAVTNDVIWRTYDSDGVGGLFPLRYPDKDQRDVELWYQLNAYLLEHE